MDHKSFVDLNKIKKVLFCMFKYHGDVLLSSPVYQVLKNHYPHIEIHVYLFDDTKPMLEGHPAIDTFHVFSQKMRKKPLWKKLLQEIKMLKYLRHQQFDAVINLTSGDRGAIVAITSGAKIRVGIKSRGGIWRKDQIFTHLVNLPTTPRHIVEMYLDALRILGVYPKSHERDLLFYGEKVYDLPKRSYVLVHPYTRTSMKLWPLMHFRKLMHQLVQKGFFIVVTGGPGKEEMEYVSQLTTGMSQNTVLQIAGKTSLPQLAYVVKHADFVLCVDTVVAHLASAYKKPCAVIYGPSDDQKWGPWRNPHARVIRKQLPCMRCDQEGCGGTWISDCLETLSPEEVFQQLPWWMQSSHPKLKIIKQNLHLGKRAEQHHF